MVTRARPNVTLYVQYSACLVILVIMWFYMKCTYLTLRWELVSNISHLKFLVKYIYIYIYIFIHIYMCVYICMYRSVYVCMYVCKRASFYEVSTSQFLCASSVYEVHNFIYSFQILNNFDISEQSVQDTRSLNLFLHWTQKCCNRVGSKYGEVCVSEIVVYMMIQRQLY